LHGSGALEHSQSSLYIFRTNDHHFQTIEKIMVHEFLHILTPLNLHSEIIHKYNFEKPTASRHIWLYEGVTEWGAFISLLRSGQISLEEYLQDISKKMNSNDSYDATFSLHDMSIDVYSERGQEAFGNFYNRGALTATILDMKLLELSNYKMGLQDVFLKLVDKYGKNRAFIDSEFYENFVSETYPEIDQFITKYIKGTEPLPIKEYFAKMGFEYVNEKMSDDKRPTMGLDIRVRDKKFMIDKVSERALPYGFKIGDEIIAILGEELTTATGNKVLGLIGSMQPGDDYEMVVKRDNKEVVLSTKFFQRMQYHTFLVKENISLEESKFRKTWLAI